MRLIFLGPPGAGKGTQAVLLSSRRGVVYLSSGDLLRDAAKAGGPRGEQVARCMRDGVLVPDALVMQLILDRLAGFSRGQSFVLDGFPRTEPQARALDRRLQKAGQAPIDRVVDFRISAEKVIRRLAGRRICRDCGAIYHLENLKPRRIGVCDRCSGPLEVRVDDRPETIEKRLKVYEEQTAPLLQFYRSQGKLRDIGGDLEIEAQYRDLLGLLEREGMV